MSFLWNSITSSFSNLIAPLTTATTTSTTKPLPRIFLCHLNDMKDGEMKEIPIELNDKNYKVLLSRLPGPIFYCTSHLCTHYRARLVTGVLNCRDGTVTCPWHVAAWDLKTGDIEEAPALKGLQKHSIEIDDDSVFLLPEIEKLDNAMVLPITKCIPSTICDKVYIIIGGGAAGAVASVNLRAKGFLGRIILITQEPYHPIDRIKLSKSLLQNDPTTLSLHPQSYLEDDLGIEYLLSTKCTFIDPVEKIIHICDDSDSTVDSSDDSASPKFKKQKFDKLLIATGASPVLLPIPNATHPNCHVLRTIKDSNQIISSLSSLKDKIKGKIDVCIIGSSFIGLECAAMLAKLKILNDSSPFEGCNVNIIGMDSYPFERSLGADVGQWVMDLHEKQGNVKFIMNEIVTEICLSDDNSIDGVFISGGSIKIPCQLVIMGVGVRCLSGESLFPSGTFTENHPGDRSIPIDSYQRVIGKGIEEGTIFAAGDVASICFNNSWKRIEHWDVAQQQGRIASHNMTCTHDLMLPYKSIPFFFTMQYGKSIRFAGYIPPSEGWKRTIFIKDSDSFVCYYCDAKDSIIALSTLGRDPLAAHCLNLMKNGMMPTAAQIESLDAPIDPLSIALE